METLVKELLRHLGAQKDLHIELLKLSEAKKSALIDNVIDELDRIVRSEQALLMKAGELERRRKAAHDSLLRSAGITANLSLKEIAEIVPTEQKDEILRLHDEFSDVLKRQMKANEVNRQLLESRISYINLMIGNMSQGMDTTNRYGSEGEDARGRDQKSNIIDRKV